MRVLYELIAKVESSDGSSNHMESKRRLSVLTPEFSPPIYDQQVFLKQGLRKMGIFNYGTSSVTCVLQKDVLYPKEILSLQAWIDNSQCNKPVKQCTARLLRRI